MFLDEDMTMDPQNHLKFVNQDISGPALPDIISGSEVGLTLTGIDATSHFASTHLSQIWDNIVEQSITTLYRIFNQSVIGHHRKKWTNYLLQTVKNRNLFSTMGRTCWFNLVSSAVPKFLGMTHNLWVISYKCFIPFYLRITNANVIHVILSDYPLGLFSGIHNNEVFKGFRKIHNWKNNL